MQGRLIESKVEYKSPVCMAETYFAIPQDLEILENISVLEYLKDHVWLSSRRQKNCKIVFDKLIKFNSCEWEKELKDAEECGEIGKSNLRPTEICLPMVFLGVALVDLFEFPATHYNMTELYKYLENDKLRFREIDFRTWCGISAFAERMVREEPLECENLEKADFQYLKTYGDWCDFSLALRNIFDVIQKSHGNVPFCKCERTLR